MTCSPPWPDLRNRGPRGPWPCATTTTSGVVKTKGAFTRRRHLETDEVFLVLSGSLSIRPDDDEVTLSPGQLYVVPRECTTSRCPSTARTSSSWNRARRSNTGDTPSDLTAERRVDCVEQAG